MKKQLTLFFIIISLIIACYGYLLFFASSVNGNESINLKINSGNNFKQVYKKLSATKRINRPLIIYYTAILLGFDQQIQAGMYHIDASSTAWQLLLQLKQGEITNYKITFVEGWRFSQIQKVVDSSPNLIHTVANISSENLAKLLKIKHENLEGWLYPDTYYYNDNTQDVDLYNQALIKMQNTLNNNWKNKTTTTPYKNAYEALIVASLIERETSHVNEYAEISGVIINRLKKNMRLQIDAAVFYGLNKTSGQLSKKDLKTKTPYNLYKRYGLPPTPIAMPIDQAIYAALHPNKSKYLYYVLAKNGGHVFSEDYTQHLKAVKMLRLREKKLNIKEQS